MPTSQQDDRDFELGNLPEGLNVTESLGAPSHLKIAASDDLSLKQDIGQFGLAGKIWQSAYTLQALFDYDNQDMLQPNYIIPKSYYICNNNNQKEEALKPFRILELGAGTGYVGIALAKLLKRSCQVYITDLEQVIPLIQENVHIHTHQEEEGAEIIVDRLHWGNKQDANKLLRVGQFDLVVVSDCVYFPELFGMLLDTLLDVCTPSTQIVIGYKCRSLEKEVGFWQDYFGRYFEYEPIRRLEKVIVVDKEKEEERLELGDLLGVEEQLYVFVGKKRSEEEQVKIADDTFTTLLFCSMGI